MNDDHTSSSPARQRRLITGALVLAGTAGLGAGLWFSARRPSPALAGEALPPDFWTHQFDTLSNTPLNLSQHRDHPLLLNFWATWCPPCVKEMPELQRFHEVYQPKGWQVIGLAIDGPTPVREFLAKTKVNFPIGLAGFGGTELATALGNQSGGLPFSVLIDSRGRLRHRKMGATHFDELAQWADKTD